MSDQTPHEVILDDIRARATSYAAASGAAARGVVALREEALEDLGGLRALLNSLTKIPIPHIDLEQVIRRLQEIPGVHPEIAQTIEIFRSRR